MVAITRRLGLGLLAAVGLGTPFARRAVGQGRALWFGTRLDAAGDAHATAFDGDGRKIIDIPLPARGHGVSIAPDRRHAVVLGRRPGLFAFVFDMATGDVTARLVVPDGRHLCGHGIHTADGRLFLATETDWEGERGLLGVYDVANGYRRVAEWESGGLDPHDVRVLPDGRHAVVANGGILTHPDAPGAKLNLADMDSSLAVIDLRDGSIVRQHRLSPELFQLSIRHLAVGAEGDVAFAMQYEGPSMDSVPLGGILRRDGRGELLDMPREDLRALRHYFGSMASDDGGTIFGMTSPRGGKAVFFRYADGAYLGARDLSDVCPIAADPGVPGQFYLAGGHGGIAVVRPKGVVRELSGALAEQAHWDNHMIVAVPS